MAMAAAEQKILIAIHDPDLLKDFEDDMYITELKETSKIPEGDFIRIKGALISGAPGAPGAPGAFVALMSGAQPSVLGCKNGGLSLFSMLKKDDPETGSSEKEEFLKKARKGGPEHFKVDAEMFRDEGCVVVIYNNSEQKMAVVDGYIGAKTGQIKAALGKPPIDLSDIFPKKLGSGAAAAGAEAAAPGSAAPGAERFARARREADEVPVKGAGDEDESFSRKYMKMSGGAKKKSKKASKKRSKKASKKMSGGAKKKSKKASKKRSKKASKKMSGGAKKKSKKASKKRSKKASKKMSGGAKKKSKKASKKRSKKASKK